MRLRAWFNVVGGICCAALIGVGSFIAFCIRDWDALAIFAFFLVLMVFGVARNARWLIES
jgi:hypothetical protein